MTIHTTCPINPGIISEALSYLLQKLIRIDRAQKGNIQLYHTKTKELTIIAQSGFGNDFLDYFKIVRPFDSSACGRAMGIGSPVLIDNVMMDVGFAPHRDIAQAADFRAVKSVPILSRDGRFVGIASTHFQQPQLQWDLKKGSYVIAEIGLLLNLAAA